MWEVYIFNLKVYILLESPCSTLIKVFVLPCKPGRRKVGEEVERVAEEDRLNLAHQLHPGDFRNFTSEEFVKLIFGSEL